jgi:hypothetical protein
MVAALLGAVALGPRTAAADPPTLNGVRIDQLQLASPESVFFRTEGPHNPMAEGVEFAAGLTFEYGHGLLHEVVVDTSGKPTAGGATLVDNALLARVSGSITPLHWLSFDLSLPFALVETGSAPQTIKGFLAPAGTEGVGDLRIGAHFRVLDKKDINVLLGGRVWAPFGTQTSYLSDHHFRAEIDVAVAGDVGNYLYGCTANVAPGFFAQRAGDRIAAS